MHTARQPARCFDRLVTETAQRGYYIVYLLRRDGEGVYLSLNQGATAVHQEVGGRRYLSVLQDRATVYSGLLRSEGLNGLDLGPVDLGGEGTLARGYEAANIAGRYYDANAVPNDGDLHDGLRRFLGLYRRLVEANDQLTAADTPGEGPDGVATGHPETAGSHVRPIPLHKWISRASRNPPKTPKRATWRLRGPQAHPEASRRRPEAEAAGAAAPPGRPQEVAPSG